MHYYSKTNRSLEALDKKRSSRNLSERITRQRSRIPYVNISLETDVSPVDPKIDVESIKLLSDTYFYIRCLDTDSSLTYFAYGIFSFREMMQLGARSDFALKRQEEQPHTAHTHIYTYLLMHVQHTKSLPHRIEYCVTPFIPDYRANRASKPSLARVTAATYLHRDSICRCRARRRVIISGNYAEIN